MSTAIWLPVPKNYTAALPISGVTARWTYTCPAGLQARCKFVSFQLNPSAAAVNTIILFFDATISGIIVRLLEYKNPAVIATDVFQFANIDILLFPGDTVTANTLNVSAVTPNIVLSGLVEQHI